MEMEEETEQGWILGPRPRGANQSGAFVPKIGPVQDRPLGSLPSPEMDFTDLPMDWNEVREYLCRKGKNVVDWEILQVIRSSDARRFQLQVAKPDNETTTWKGLPWMLTHLRRFQGHNAYVQKQGRFARMIKQLYP